MAVVLLCLGDDFDVGLRLVPENDRIDPAFAVSAVAVVGAEIELHVVLFGEFEKEVHEVHRRAVEFLVISIDDLDAPGRVGEQRSRWQQRKMAAAEHPARAFIGRSIQAHGPNAAGGMAKQLERRRGGDNLRIQRGGIP